VWSPHDEYGHLARLVVAARGYAPGRPVILAAYLEPFARDRAEKAEWAARLALATIFAHGGHALLLGEGDGVLVDPYYPKFARLGAAGAEVLRAYQDFAVANCDLLYDPDAVDVTTSMAGGINDDIELDASVDPVPGRLWVRARRGGGGLVLQLIDLTGQQDLRWNVGKSPSGQVTGARLRIRCPQGTVVFAGSPENGPELRRVATERDGDYAGFAVPAFSGWTVIWLPAQPAVASTAVRRKLHAAGG
jgi:dextranase